MSLKILLTLTLLLPLLLKAQSITIAGTVSNSETAKPLAAATVSSAGSTASTITKADGSFSIEIPSLTDTLKITHAGYLPAVIAINSKARLNILLVRNTALLAEVIVNTGFQSISRERATGSFEVLGKEQLNQQVTTNVTDRLEAIANGLYVDRTTSATPRVVIRGLSSIQGPRAPLIILDNFPYEGSLDNINPNDVENITVLKDAAAASIWGTRAGNGVIVITTKKARHNQPLKTEANNSISFTSKPDLYYQPNITADDFIGVEQYLFGKGYFTSQLNSSSKTPLSPVVEILAAQAAGTITPAQAKERIDGYRGNDVRNDFSKYLYKPAVNRQHYLSLATGNSFGALNFSAGLDENNSNLGDRYSRVNLKADNNYRLLAGRLQLSTAIYYTQSKYSAGNSSYESIGTLNGKLPVYSKLADPAGGALPVIKNYRQAYIDTAGGGKLLDWNYYPLADDAFMDNTSKLQSLIINAGLGFNVSKALTATIRFQYESQAEQQRKYYHAESYLARNLANSYAQLNRTTGMVSWKVPVGGILDNSSNNLASYNVRGQFSYSKKWRAHQFDALAGTDVRQLKNDFNGNRLYGYNDELLTSQPVDYVTPYPNYVSGSLSTIPENINLSQTVTRYVSYFGNMGYSYQSKYSVTASVRRDASNLFGVKTNDRWTPLWSAGASWDIGRERFYTFSHVPVLKLRATYGVSGNADASRSGLTTIAYAGNSTYFPSPQARIDQYYNPGLRWEKTQMLNLGVDFSALKTRLYGSVEYYIKKGKDLFGTEAVDYTGLPVPTLLKNVASMKGEGWDISLTSVNTKGSVRWTSDINFNINKSRVTDYYLATQQGSTYVTGGTVISAIPGRPVYAVYAYRWAGLDSLTGDPMGYINGKVSKDYTALTGSSTLINDLVYKGSALPVVFASLGNSLSWKGFSLNIRFTGKFGYYFQRGSVNYGSLFANREGHSDYALRWQKPGDEKITNVPSMVYPAVTRRDNFYKFSEILVEKADHIRLQYITLSYEVSKQKVKKLPVNSLQLYVNINNLGIVWRANKYGIDPDMYRSSAYPVPLNMAAGLRIGF